jgi:hypothetical protein
MLSSDLQAFHGESIELPRRRVQHPDPDRLELRTSSSRPPARPRASPLDRHVGLLVVPIWFRFERIRSSATTEICRK